MKYFPDKDLTFKLGSELDCYNFDLIDSVQDIFKKYYKVDNHRIAKEEQKRLLNLIDPDQTLKPMCHILDNLRKNYNIN